MTPARGREGETAAAPRRPLDPLEVMVRDIWQDVLGARIGSVTDRFADLGGMRALLSFLMEDCCGGRPEACAPLLSGMTRSCGTNDTPRGQ